MTNIALWIGLASEILRLVEVAIAEGRHTIEVEQIGERHRQVLEEAQRLLAKKRQSESEG